jgi:hypothetical protein
VKVICSEILDKKFGEKGISIIYFCRGELKHRGQKAKKRMKGIQFKDFKEYVLKQI